MSLMTVFTAFWSPPAASGRIADSIVSNRVEDGLGRLFGELVEALQHHEIEIFSSPAICAKL
jgi:hypothetical protein